MDPLASQAGIVGAVKPVLALSGDLGSVLREGRVVAGEVLQTMDGKSLLIGVGNHRVPADSAVDLSLGDRFLARVELTEDGPVLRVLGDRAKGELRLVRALKQVLGEDRPVGRLLRDLASKLRAAMDTGESPKAVKELFEKLGDHIFLPGASASDLRALLARSGMDLEALLLAESEGGKAAVQMKLALGNLVKQLLGGLQEMWSAAAAQLTSAQMESLGNRLLKALSGLDLADLGDDPDERLLRLTAAIRARMGAAVASSTSGAQRELAMAGLEDLLSKLLGEKGKLPLSRNILGALLAGKDPDGLVGNLKAQLLTALAKVPEGPAHESVTKALAGIESEQLLNLARREFHEGWHLSIPVPDGEKWATAHLFYTEPDDQHGGSNGNGEDMQRITVSVDFSAIGPLRGEIGVRDDLVAMRLMVQDQKVADRLQGEAQELVERLSTGGRKVRVAVVLGTKDELAHDALTRDVRWLKEHHLMDLSG